MGPNREPALDALTTEGINPSSEEIDRLTALEVVRIMNSEDETVAGAVRAALPQIAEAVEGIAERLRKGGRLMYVGAGTSGRLGVLDASECPPTFSVPPGLVIGIIAGGERALTSAVEEIEDRPEEGRHDLERLGVRASDAVVGLTTSGRTPYVLGALEYAREVGALPVAVTCNRGTPVEELGNPCIRAVVGPEVISGSTRLKAGTAQKMILNMLSTGAMILLGKTYGNLMVDLRPTNSKLRQRLIRIVREVTGLEEEEAARQLRQAGDAKTAIVASLAGISTDEARARLEVAEGVVRRALEMG